MLCVLLAEPARGSLCLCYQLFALVPHKLDLFPVWQGQRAKGGAMPIARRHLIRQGRGHSDASCNNHKYPA